MKLPSLEDEGERRIIDKRLRLLATISLLSMIVPILVSSITVHTTFVIASSSMTPTLMPGDIVTTSLTNGEIANGTIIVFKSPFGGYEAHRVVGESSLGKDVYYSTKGDANNRTDSFLVSGAYIVGPVSRVIPKLGLFFMIPREIVLLATISLVFFYVFLTFKTRDESDKRESTDQLKEDQEQSRKKIIFQTCCVISILVLTNCVTSFASIKLIYCTSPNTVSLTSPKVVLQNGNTGSSTIYDNGINANVTVQALPWLSSWKYRSQMTLDHNDITSNLSNFPTLIYLSSSSGINGADVTSIFNEVGSNNKKIAVTTSDGITQCYVEIEKWDSVSKKAWLWVKVPSISSTIDTVLYIYYDSSQQDNTAYVGDPGSVTAQSVWESNFMAVLHLTETSGTHYDSTPNSNIGTPQGGVAQGAAGKVDGADTFDGTSGYVNYGNATSLNFGVNSPFTFEGWVKTTESYGAIISQRHGTDDGAVIDICLGYDGAVRSAGRLMGLVRQSSSSSGYARVTGPIVNDGNWHYFTLARNSGNTIELFVDGISQGTASSSASGGAITTNLRALGSERRWEQDGWGTADDRYLNGAIDEVRTSNIQRSAAWIKASHESERDNFVRWEGQGTLSGWGYRKSHVINPSSGAGTNYQVRITAYYGSGTDSGASVYLNGESRTDFGDVRFTDDDGTTLLDYWMESKVDGVNAVFWVEVADDLSTEDQTIYIYYGKSDATTTSDGTNTFNFFDDFSGDLSKWSRDKTSGVYPRIENGYVRAGGGTTSSPYGHTSLGSSPTYSAFLNNAVLYKARMSLNGIGEVVFRGNFAANTGYKDRHDQRSGQGQSFLKPPYSGWGFITGAGADGDVPSADVWYTFEITAVGNTFKLYRWCSKENSY